MPAKPAARNSNAQMTRRLLNVVSDTSKEHAKPAVRNSSAQMVKHLVNVVSDTYLLMIKTHGYHWNVTGPLFPQLHLFLETQYNELFAAADEVAERIRALDF